MQIATVFFSLGLMVAVSGFAGDLAVMGRERRFTTQALVQHAPE